VLGLAGISGFVDVDPITLSVAKSAGESLTIRSAAQAILLAAAANMVTKTVVAVGVGGVRFGWKLVLAGVLALLAGAAALIRPHPSRRSFVMIVIAVFLAGMIGLKLVGVTVVRRESTRDLLAAAATRGYGNTPIVQLHTVERSAEFYASGRLTYGSDGEPVKFEGAAQVADAARRNGGAVLCFVPIEFESQLTNLSRTNSEVISDNGSVALLMVRTR